MQLPAEKRLWGVVLITLSCLVGCSEPEGIRIYTVAKKERMRTGSSAAPDAPSSSEQQMLGAIIRNGDIAWYFKMVGEPTIVSKNQPEFQRIVQSVSFQGPLPTFELPEGWTKQASQGIIHERLFKKADGLEATVTDLPIPPNLAKDEAGWHDYVAQNVNRWREQLALARQDWDVLQADLEEVEGLAQGPAKAYLVSLKGRGGGSMGGPFSRGPMMNRPATPPSQSSSNEEAGGKSQPDPAETKAAIDFELPANWQALDVSSHPMRVAAFAIAIDDDSQAEVTLIPAGGDIKSNLGIWFGQVSLEPTDAKIQKVIDEADSISINGSDAKMYRLDGSATPAKKSILITGVPWKNQETLFVKLMGDSELVDAQQESYTEFLKSLKW